MVKLSAWGRLSSSQHTVHALADRTTVADSMAQDTAQFGRGLAYGMGRSYGDVCLNPDGLVWRTTGLDRLIAFDPASGVLRCEAGMLLQDLQRWCMPRAWRLPIVPGTQLITVGGAIANDVHGKNHHRFGSFGDHLRSFQLARTDGSLSECVAGEPLFAATVGGLGLTGVITQAEIQLQPSLGPWLQVESLPYRDLSEFFALADSSEQNWEHTVSWIDCLNRAGRGIFLRANEVASDRPLPAKKSARRVPLVPPLSLVNRFSLRPFNALYYQLKKSQSASPQYYEDFFHPLDSLHDWNRIYGPRGFYQYQCVLPRATGQAGIQALLQQIHRANAGSFLAVLKTFGARPSVGMLSFAQPGVTLALDFPNHGAASLELFASLDAVVREAGGRLYMAKDARMPRDLFEAGYPRLSEFLEHRDPGISSAMSRRLMGS